MKGPKAKAPRSMNTPSTQIMVSKYLSPLKGRGDPGLIVPESTEVLKNRFKQKNGGDISKRHEPVLASKQIIVITEHSWSKISIYEGILI